jgi:hypothetical protein
MLVEMFLHGKSRIVRSSLRLLKHFSSFRFTHLNHTPFTYNLQINNDGSVQRMGMVRVFLAPKNDERGQNMLFRDQRLMFIEMDKFVVTRMFQKKAFIIELITTITEV